MSNGFEWQPTVTPNVWHRDSTGYPFTTQKDAENAALRHGWSSGNYRTREVPYVYTGASASSEDRPNA